MNGQQITEELKDRLASVLATEYARLNPPGVRQHLATLEIFLGAVATAFLVPFAKKLAEKAAEGLWNHLSKPGSQGVTELMKADLRELLASSQCDLDTAIAEGCSSANKILEKNGMPEPIRAAALAAIASEVRGRLTFDSRYAVEDTQVDTTIRTFMHNRYGLTGSLTDSEVILMTRAMEAMEKAASPDRTPMIRELADNARAAYENHLIGSWALGCIRCYSATATWVTEAPAFPQREYLQIRAFARLFSCVALKQESTLETLVATYFQDLIEGNGGAAIKSLLDSERSAHNQAFEWVLDSATMTQWFRRIIEMIPYLDSQFVAYRCLDFLLSNQRVANDALLTTVGIDRQLVAEELNRLDEAAAYLCSHGTSWYKGCGNAYDHYMQEISRFATEKGVRAALRQLQYDVARMHIPRMLAADVEVALRGRGS
jgi:hypothetical protein